MKKTNEAIHNGHISLAFPEWSAVGDSELHPEKFGCSASTCPDSRLRFGGTIIRLTELSELLHPDSSAVKDGFTWAFVRSTLFPDAFVLCRTPPAKRLGPFAALPKNDTGCGGTQHDGTHTKISVEPFADAVGLRMSYLAFDMIDIIDNQI